MYGMDSRLKLGDQLKTSEQSKKLGDLYLEKRHHFSCSEDFSIKKQVSITVY